MHSKWLTSSILELRQVTDIPGALIDKMIALVKLV
jgi:hypothetical protein